MVAGELTATEATTREFARTIMHDRYNTLASLLFEIEKELNPIDVMFLYRIIEWLGDLADNAQRVGHQMGILLAK